MTALVGLPRALSGHAHEDVSEFIDTVDEVSRLIAGLKEGSISPEYIDGKIAAKETKHAEKDTQQQPQQPAAGAGKQQANVEQQGADEELRKERLMAKVEEIKANMARKRAARQKFEEYIAKKDTTTYGTDYMRWDMWCPEDEEDDMINSLTPNNPGIQAMEKDINERHKRMVEQRQIAERRRVEGNAAFKAGQYAEALRCYEIGIASQKTNMNLHANAAMAALKLKCFVQAIEHCDKVLSIAEFLHNNTKDPLCAKAYQRRAVAYLALQQPSKAVADLESAVGIDPANKELQQQLANAQRELEEHRKQKQLKQLMAKGTAGADVAENLNKLRQVEQRLQQLERQLTTAPCNKPANEEEHGTQATPKAPVHGPQLPERRSKQQQQQQASRCTCPITESCAALEALLRDDDPCCVYFRECGGLQLVASRVVHSPACPNAADRDASARCASFIRLLNTACMNDGNMLQLPTLGILPACVELLSAPDASSSCAAVALLCTAATNDDVRKLISQQLGTAKGLGGMFEFINKTDSSMQAAALALLGNCMVDKPCKLAMHTVLSTTAATDCLTKLVQSPSSAVQEKTLALLGNMCGEPQLRQAMCSQQQLLSVVLELSCSNTAKISLRLAAATTLYNLTIDMPAVEAVVGESGRVEQLAAALSDQDMWLAARAAGVLSRCAKHQVCQQHLATAGTIQQLVALARRSLSSTSTSASASASSSSSSSSGSQQHGSSSQHTSTSSSSSSGGSSNSGSSSGRSGSSYDHRLESTREAAVFALDAIVRIHAVMLAADNPELVSAFLQYNGLDMLLQTIATKGTDDKVLGNAALCMGHIARNKEHLQLLHSKDAVAPLVQLAYHGKGNTVSKNAAIALARMAHHPAMLERLKELHGIEIIYQYVKF